MTAGQETIEVDGWTDVLGGLVERYPRLWTTFGNWETRLLSDRIAETTVDRPVYVTGLARAGSTILLELLARHPETASHRYRDFPMVLTPWAWNWFVDRAGGNEHEAKERAHRDRILVTPESPEAFEEVVWTTFFPEVHEPGHSAVLDGTTANPAFEAFYVDHIRKILALRGAPRYLAKGNYNVTRLGYLTRLFPGARFVVPVRDPIWHIASLMKQHELFASAGAKDDRVRRHLRRSGHYEFGLDRREINVGDADAAREVRELWRNGEEVAGWAAHWAAVYGHIAEMLTDPSIRAATRVVRYEDFCADAAGTMKAVLDHCELPPEGLPATAREMVSPPGYYEPSFTPAERATIRERTASVAARFGYVAS